MVQQHIFDVVATEPDLSADDKDAVLRFDPQAAVRAMVFHLLDENLAKSIAPDTIDRTVARLADHSIAPSIARRRWVKMSNLERLRWMLQESHTTTRIGVNEVIRLRAKRSRA